MKKTNKRSVKTPSACDKRRVTVNVRKVASETTDLNVSADALFELHGYTEIGFLPRLITLAEKYAKAENMKTIKERHVLKARDMMNHFIVEVSQNA